MRAKSPVPTTTTGLSFCICVQGVYRQPKSSPRQPSLRRNSGRVHGLTHAGNSDQSDSKFRSVETPLQNEKRPHCPAAEDQTEGNGEDGLKGDLANSARESLRLLSQFALGGFVIGSLDHPVPEMEEQIR